MPDCLAYPVQYSNMSISSKRLLQEVIYGLKEEKKQQTYVHLAKS